MTNQEPRPRFIWLKLEPAEIIELKRLVMDRNASAAAAFFHAIVLPGTLEAARRCGILDDGAPLEENHGHLSR